MGELSTCIFLANAELPDRLFHPHWNSHVFRELSHHLHEHIDAKDKAARSSSATRSQIGPRSSGRRASAPIPRSWARARSTMPSAARSHACTRSCVWPTAPSRPSPRAPRNRPSGARAPAGASCSRCRGAASGARPDGRTAGHAPASGAPIHVARVRADRNGHDVGGQVEHALERIG